MSQEQMFTDLPITEAVQNVPQTLPPREIRIKEPVRNQVEIVCRDLDSFLPENHTVRLICAFLDRIDLDSFYRQVQAYFAGPGRPATSAKVLLTLVAVCHDRADRQRAAPGRPLRARRRLPLDLRRCSDQLPHSQRLSRRAQSGARCPDDRHFGGDDVGRVGAAFAGGPGRYAGAGIGRSKFVLQGRDP